MASRSYSSRRQSPSTFGAGVVLAVAALFWLAPNTANRFTESAVRVLVAVTAEASQTFIDQVLSGVTTPVPAEQQQTPR